MTQTKAEDLKALASRACESLLECLDGIIDAMAEDVPPPVHPVINYFRAVPESIELGQQSELHWRVTGADEVWLGTIDVTGLDSYTILPDQTLVYTLSALKADLLEVTASVKVTVTELPPPPPADNFKIEALLIDTNQAGPTFTTDAASGQIRITILEPAGATATLENPQPGLSSQFELRYLYVNFSATLPEGTYPLNIRLKDANSNTATRVFTLVKGEPWTDPAWSKQNRVLISPQVLGTDWRWGDWGFVNQQVSGTVTLSLKIAKQSGLAESGENMVVQWEKDGQPWGVPIQGDLHKTWDTTKEEDKPHAVSVRIVSVDGNRVRYRPWPSEFRTVNGNKPTAPYLVPVLHRAVAGAGDVLLNPQDSGETSLALQWMTFTGKRERRADLHPYPAKVAPPAANDAERLLLADPKNWVIEPTCLRDHWGHTIPFWCLDDKGIVLYGQFFPRGGVNTEDSIKEVSKRPQWCGPRNDNTVTEYSTFAALPDGSWLFVSITGRIGHRRKDGSIATICGYAIKPGSLVVPMDPRNGNITPEQVRKHQEVLVAGDFSRYAPGGFNQPNDLCIDANNPNVVYVADTQNNRIAKVTFQPGWTSPVVTTHADLGRHQPYSLVQGDDGLLYFACRLHGVAARVNADGSYEELVADEAMRGAQVIRKLSDGQLVVFTTAADNDPAKLYRIDLTGDVVKLMDVPYAGTIEDQENVWIWMDVDTAGSIGPVDAVYLASSLPRGERSSILQVLLDANKNARETRDFLASCNGGPYTFGALGYKTIVDPFGHYPWAFAISPYESRFIATGFGSVGAVEWRRRLPGDPVDHPEDLEWFKRGQRIHFTGTIPGQPLDSRPPFAALHGAFLSNWAGNVRDADDLASLGRDALIAEIQKGLDSGVPRPEITGDHARAYAYFIEKCSMVGWLKDVRP